VSADNMVCAMPFKKMDGHVVWRVFEAFMSSMPWDVCHTMSVQARTKKFIEFTGEGAGAKARAAAKHMARQLPVCEYGVSGCDDDEPARTMSELQEEAIKAGYGRDRVYELREASDDELSRMEVAYCASLG
jgi:hypothetical protein